MAVDLEIQNSQLIAIPMLCSKLLREINGELNFMDQLLFQTLLVEMTGSEKDVENVSSLQQELILGLILKNQLLF